MWLVGIGIGLAVVAGVGIALVLLARLLPAGPTREAVAFAPNCVILLRRLRGDPRVHGRSRLALGAALLYVLSPIQLIPNFIPIIGQTDDLAVVIAALRYACRQLPRQDVVAAWPGDPAYLERLLGRPRPSTNEED